MVRQISLSLAVAAAIAASAAIVPNVQATPTVSVLGVSGTSNSTNWLSNGLGQIGTTKEAVDWNVAGYLGFSFIEPNSTVVSQDYLTSTPGGTASPLVQFFSSSSGLTTSSQNFGVSDNLGWESNSTIFPSLISGKNLLISEVAPAAGTYYLSIGTTTTGNSSINGISATQVGQVLQWIIVNPTASDTYWFNASQTSSLTTHGGGVTNAGNGPIGFSTTALAPEPTTLSLLAVGVIGLLAARRKARHSH